MFHRVKSESGAKKDHKDNNNITAFKKPDHSHREDNDIGVDIENETNSSSDIKTGADASTKSHNDTKTITETKPSKEEENKTMSQTEQSQQASQETAPQNYQPTGYPGSKASYGYVPTQSQGDHNDDRRLTIGAGITMSGEIESCDYLLVEGTVEAALKGARDLDIADTGVFYGTVEIEDATIAGRFEGDITAHGRLTLREGANVTGTIAYKELEIEAGAVIDGKLTPLSAVAPAAARPSAKVETKPTAPAREAKVQNHAAAAPQPANTDGSLFSKATTAAE